MTIMILFEQIPTEFPPFIDLVVCSHDEEGCMKGECETCKDQVLQLKPFETGQVIKYEQWIKSTKDTLSGTATDCFEKLVEQLPVFLHHTYIKRKQHHKFELDCKRAQTSPDTDVLQIDFAENYKYSKADSTQGYHWVNNQATVFTGYV